LKFTLDIIKYLTNAFLILIKLIYIYDNLDVIVLSKT